MSDQLSKQMDLQRVISRALENFKKVGRVNLTAAKIRSRIASLKESWLRFLDGHTMIKMATPEPNRASMAYFKDGIFDATEDHYQTTLDFMSEWLEDKEPPVSPQAFFNSSASRTNPSGLSLQHFPPIKIPPFNGDLSQWEPFRDRFTSVVRDNHELNDCARMHYLMSSLTGRAYDSVSKIPATADNFEVAWKALVSRYESKRRLLHSHLSSVLNLAPLTRESAKDLASLRDTVNLAITGIENLNRSPQQLWHDVLVHTIVQKFDSATRKLWSNKLSDNDEPPSFEDLDKFLASRSRALEEYCPNSTTPTRSQTANSTSRVSASTATGAMSSCPLCKARHYFSSCPVFLRADTTQRRDLVKQHRRCFNCLSASHTSVDCKSKFSCRTCRRRHHTLIHSHSISDAPVETSEPCARSNASTSDPSPSSVVSYTHSSVNSLITSTRFRPHYQVLLATAWVKVNGNSGRALTVRTLLDQGSEATFVTENLSQLLRTKRIRIPVSISGVGGVNAGTSRHATSIRVCPRDVQAPSFATTALILKNLTT